MVFNADPLTNGIQELLRGTIRGQSTPVPSRPFTTPRRASPDQAIGRKDGTLLNRHDGEGSYFLVADGEHLPVKNGTFTAAISECSMCLMPESRKALREIFLVLRPLGRIGITDIAIDGPLPSELEEALMQFLCVTNEISWSEYRSVIEAEGFVRVKVSDESVSLRELLETIKKRLLVAELLTAVGKLPIRRDQLERGKRLVTHAKAAVDRGSLRYAMITAQKPNA